MKHYAVIGMPVEHSRSPEIYEELFRKHQIDADFIRLPVSPEEMHDIRNITKELYGFAVTMPHKKSIIEYLDSLEDSAKACGAVNIVERRGEKLIGHNTDGAGLVDVLTDAGCSLNGKKAVIMGRGGAALSAAYSLKQNGCQVVLLVRTLSYKNEYKEELIGSFNGKADIFINASPLGMSGMEDYKDFTLLDRIEPDTVFDMVYRNDRKTNLISEAERRRLLCFDGRSMLYKQALRAFYIFTGIVP